MKISINEEEIYETIIASLIQKNTKICLYYCLSHCRPCKKIKPILDAIIEEEGGWVYVTIKMDEFENLFDIKKFPTIKFIVKRNKDVVLSGIKEKNIEDEIRKTIKLYKNVK